MIESLRHRTYRLLRASERYLKTDLVYLARGSWWSFIGQVIIVVSGLALATIVGRFLPKETYGEYKYILALVAFLTVFAFNTISAAVLQSTARGFDGALEQGFKLNLRWSIFMVLGAFLLGGYYLIRHNLTLGFGILVGGCLSPLIASASLGNVFLAGKKDFARQNLYFGAGTAFISAAALSIAVLTTHSALAIAITYFVVNAAAAFYFYRRVLRLYRPDPSRIDPEMVSYGKHLGILGIIGSIVAEIDQILLFHFTGPVNLALYNFAIGIPDQLKGPLKNLDTMAQVRFVNYQSTDIRKNMHFKMLLLFAFSITAIALYVLLAPFIFRILFPLYRDVVPYTQVYMLSFLSTIFTPSGSYLGSKKLIRAIYINNLVSYGLQIVGMTVGVILWGLWGLIWAIVAIRFASGLGTYALYLHASRANPRASL